MVFAVKAECQLWAQIGDDRRNAPQRARCADSSLRGQIDPLLCAADGCPVAVEVLAGNTADPMTLAAQVDKLKQRFGLSRVVLVGGCAHRWSQLWHTRVLAQDKRQMRLRRRGTDGLSTHRWREPDSNHRSRVTRPSKFQYRGDGDGSKLTPASCR